jgi:general secretion pathway protein K
MRRYEKGVALLAVLWTLILLSTIAATLSTETRGDARIARNIADNAMARAAADAGVQRGILDLLDSRGGRQLDAARFSPDGADHVWSFGASVVLISVRDELGKLNLNQASEAHLSAVLETAGVEQGQAGMLADAIVDFRDPDKIRHLQGAEEADYLAAGLSAGPKDAPFESVEELQRVLGMTREIYDQVAPFLTLYSIGNTVNPDRADERLTAALRRIGFNYFVASPGTAYAIRAAASHASGAVFVREAVVQVLPESQISIRVLDWRQSR